ncbi:hypothetical protein TNCV_430111 [Trichonephila clavipes]|nr:hypothetical protein TNCV_430111 [Trichonephila clavipes]
MFLSEKVAVVVKWSWIRTRDEESSVRVLMPLKIYRVEELMHVTFVVAQNPLFGELMERKLLQAIIKAYVINEYFVSQVSDYVRNRDFAQVYKWIIFMIFSVTQCYLNSSEVSVVVGRQAAIGVKFLESIFEALGVQEEELSSELLRYAELARDSAITSHLQWKTSDPIICYGNLA